MTEQVVEGVNSAEVDVEHHRIVQKGKLGAETATVPSEPVNVRWQIRGQGHLVGEGRKTLAERLDVAYRDDTLEPEERGLLDRAADQFGRRLRDKE
jgi:hypothetical protein